MATIPRREDIVKKLERSEVSELQVINDSLATTLNNTKVLPVEVTPAGMGSDKIRDMVLQRLKDQGWIVTRRNPDDMRAPG